MRQSLWALLGLVALFGSEAQAFGTRRTHEGLSDRAASKAEAAIAPYLRSQLGLRHGLDEALAIQYGLDARIDEELIVRDDPNTDAIIETRLNQSLSWFDSDDDGQTVHYPNAPGDTFVAFEHSECRNALDFNACFVDLTRASVAQLLRIGVYAEDNPNPRSQHHFHDPERSHGIVGHGLDNSSALSDSLFGILALEGATALRGGTWLRAIGGVLSSPFRPLIGSIANFDLRGRSAIDRALNRSGFAGPASDDNPSNLFALPDAERYLYLALTSSRVDDRENYLALHFIAVGHILHLLQDMASVAHVRNDFVYDHVIVDRVFAEFDDVMSLEEAGDDPDAFPDVVRVVGVSLFSTPRGFIASEGSGSAPLSFFEVDQSALDPTGFDVPDFWDRGSLDNPDDSDPARSGLAERVHNRFFSAGTIGDLSLNPVRHYEKPRLLDCGVTPGSQLGSGSDAVRIDDLPERNLAEGTKTETQHRFLASPLVPHLARCSYHALYANGPALWTFTVLDESVQRDYLELLFPLVIDYGAKFLQHYLAPRIEVVPTGPGQFTLRNLTALQFTADPDAIELAYTAVDPTRPEGRRERVEVTCGTGELSLPPKPATGTAPLGDFTCTLPTTLPDPPLRPDYWVVVRGQLGERGEVGTASEFDTGIGPKDFVVSFDHVQPEILFQSAGSPGETDETKLSDLVAIPADFSRSVARADESPPLRNLGEVLRPALAERFNLDESELARLDFISPSAEPGGFRVALALDLEQAQGTTAAAPNDVWILDLSKQPDDPAMLVLVPKGQPRLAAESNRWVAWNRDGETDDLVFAAGDPADAFEDFLVRYEVDGGNSSSRETADFPGSVHGNLMAAVPNRVDAADVSDILLVNVATGLETHRFNVATSMLDPCVTPPGCPVGNTAVQALENEPEFSPDGMHVAFVSGPITSTYQGGSLYVADLTRDGDDVTGGTLRRIGTLDHVMSPIWSPDGEWIVYSDSAAKDLFAVRATGAGPPIRITHTGSLDAGNLTWLEPLPLPTSL